MIISAIITLAASLTLLTQSPQHYPQTTVEVIINAPVDRAFTYIVPVKLAHIFKRYKNLPAVVRTDEKEKWITPGLTRTVFFEDGSRAKETLLTVTPSTSFSYKIEHFTSPLRFLAKRVEGSWLFTDLGNGQTKIRWTYQIVPKNFLARSILKWTVLKTINGLLTNALDIVKTDLETAEVNKNPISH